MSAMVEAAIAAPKVATKTRTMAGRKSSDIGSAPSRIMKARSATSEITNPIRVAGSMGQRSSRLGNGTTEETPVTSAWRRRSRGRYSPRSIS